MIVGILTLLSGLGLFLYGMNVMSNGLEKSAGDKLEKIVRTLSGNIFRGILVGALVTAIIQSSAATTIMVVGFVNVGIMTLHQAIGVIMGANIGTTVTAQLVSVDISFLAPGAIALGSSLYLFGKKSKFKTAGEVILGFGFLFFGMQIMKEALTPVKDIEWFRNLMSTISDGTFFGNIKGFIIGIILTALVQSSSVTTGVLVALASANSITLEAAFPILLGTNVGSCITAMISAISANKTAKRAAIMHLMFNVLGSFLFLFILQGPMITFIKGIDGSAPRQLANSHTMFNVINTVVLLPFAGILVKLAELVLPVTEDEKKILSENIIHLDDRMLSTPNIAMGQARGEVVHLANLAKQSLEYSIKAIKDNDLNYVNKTLKKEKAINRGDKLITEYLIKLSNTNLENQDRRRLDMLFNTINDIERIGDHAENIAELAVEKIDHNVIFSATANTAMEEMIDAVYKSVEKAINALATGDHDDAMKAIALEGLVDQLETTLRKEHIERLNNGTCSAEAGIIFLDLLSNLERISDHSANISDTVLDTHM